MRTLHRFLLLAVALLVLPCWLMAAPAPLPKRPKATVALPLEMAFHHIKKGMMDEDLFVLMAPYERIELSAVRYLWTEGKTTVYVRLASRGEFVLVSSGSMDRNGKVTHTFGD